MLIIRNLFILLLGLGLNQVSYAELTQLDFEIIADSEESFNRRIYSYDFDVTPTGQLVAVYSRPVPNEDRAQIIYMSKPVGGDWPAEADRLVLEEFGSIASISTWLIFDAQTSTSHISYIVKRDFVDENSTTHTHGLVYQTLKDSLASDKNNISSGAFHTRMQLGAQGSPIFIREYEIFTNDGITFLDPPFAKALRIQVHQPDGQWTNREHILNLPPAEDYRISNFLYEADTGRYHITYGDKNAVFLGNTYPTVNPPVTADKSPVFFPPGSGHQLWYAYSDDMQNWHSSIIDPSGNISENEFWSDLELNSEGVPYIANFRYKTDAQGIQQGSTNIIGSFTNNIWQTQTVAGKTTGASASRAGMGTKLIATANGGFHAIWDSSPDKPIDAEVIPAPGETAGGIGMYRYSPDGQHWAVRRVLFPFSIEGQIRAKLYQDKLLVMVLGDARDSRLVFGEFRVPGPTESLFEVSSDKMFYGMGEDIQLHVRLQGDSAVQNDIYLVVTGPYNVDTNNAGALVPVTTTKWWYLGADIQWHEFTDLNTLPPVVANLAMNDLYTYFMSLKANADIPPFDKPSRYRVYSGMTLDGQPKPPAGTLPQLKIHAYDLHVCNQSNCGEL